MYHDVPQRLTLLCENHTIRSGIDCFGEDVTTEVMDANNFRVAVDVVPTLRCSPWRGHPY